MTHEQDLKLWLHLELILQIIAIKRTPKLLYFQNLGLRKVFEKDLETHW